MLFKDRLIETKRRLFCEDLLYKFRFLAKTERGDLKMMGAQFGDGAIWGLFEDVPSRPS